MTTVDDRPDSDTAAPQKEIGRDRRRKEDQRLITGRTKWTDNIQLTGMLHLAILRAPPGIGGSRILEEIGARAARALCIEPAMCGVEPLGALRP